MVGKGWPVARFIVCSEAVKGLWQCLSLDLRDKVCQLDAEMSGCTTCNSLPALRVLGS
jgi:hypothetical protein